MSEANEARRRIRGRKSPGEMTLRDTGDDRFSRWGNRLSWLLVPLAAGMQLVWLRRPITVGGVTMTLELPLFGLLALIAAPWAWARIRTMDRCVQVLAGAFAALVAYALATIAWHASPVVETSLFTTVPKTYLVVPLVTALAAMAAGLGLALAPGRNVPGVRLQSLAEDDAFREIGLSWAAGRRMLPSAALFRDHVLGLAKSRRLPRPPGTFDEEHPLKSST